MDAGCHLYTPASHVRQIKVWTGQKELHAALSRHGDPEMSVCEAHALADQLALQIRLEIPDILQLLVRVEPGRLAGDPVDRVSGERLHAGVKPLDLRWLARRAEIEHIMKRKESCD